MMNLKKNIYLLASLLMIFSLTACSPEYPNAEDAKTTPALTSTDTKHKVVGKSSIEALLLNTPSYISKVFSKDFSVKADVHVPKVKKADILLAKYMPFNEEKLLSIFYNGKKLKRKMNADGYVNYNYDKSYLSINKGFVSYHSQEFYAVKYPTDSFRLNSDIFSSNPRLSDVYKQENLGFMNRSKALKSVSDILTDLSVDTIDNTEIYAIDSSTMQIQQKERTRRMTDVYKNSGFSPVPDPTDGYRIKDVFAKEDDFYILNFKMGLNDIPVTQKSYTIQASDRFINGSTATVSFSKKGIINLLLNGIYQVKGIDESPNALITMDDALQIAFEKDNSILHTEKVTVTAVDFEYVPIPYNSNYDEVKLVPTWSLTLANDRGTALDKPSKDRKKKSAPNVSYSVMFINAVTGKEIQ